MENPYIIDIILSCAIFITTYIVIMFEKFDRTTISLSGASLMILTKIITQENAFFEIELGTIALLISMMVIVMISKRTGIFEYIAIKTVKISKAEPLKILLILALVTGLLSSVLDNVTTILLILPITINIAKDLSINPIPIVIAEIFASNIGGTATLVGDPPNIMLAGSVGFSFVDFLKNDAVIAIPLLFLTTYIFMLIYKKNLFASTESKQKVLQLNENLIIKDKKLLIKCLVILCLTIVGFLLHGVLHYESSTIAIAGATLLLLITGFRSEKILKEVEWKTIFFFAGLFILIGGLKQTGVIKIIAQTVLDLTKGNLILSTLGILWGSAIASAFIDNIPFVATMIPLIQNMGTLSNMDLNPLWWALSLGACLGGNGTIIGSSANVIAVGILEEHGININFKTFFKVAFPMMLLTIIISSVYLYIFYLAK